MKYIINKNHINLPTKEYLEKVIRQTLPEVSTLRMSIENMEDSHKFSNKFIIDSIIRSSDLVRAISSLTNTNLDCINILMRSQLEVCVDLFWFYSIYLNNKIQSDNLARRFYQFNTNLYLEVSENYEEFSKTDPYLKTIESELDIKNIKGKAKQENFIELVDTNAKPCLQRLQKMNWRALPGFINKKEEIDFKARAEIASSIVIKTCNLQDAPFYKNWKVLNAFTHWTAARMNYNDENITKVIYQRNLHMSLALLYEMMTIGYLIKGINPPVKIVLLSQQLQDFS